MGTTKTGATKDTYLCEQDGGSLSDKGPQGETSVVSVIKRQMPKRGVLRQYRHLHQ